VSRYTFLLPAGNCIIASVKVGDQDISITSEYLLYDFRLPPGGQPEYHMLSIRKDPGILIDPLNTNLGFVYVNKRTHEQLFPTPIFSFSVLQSRVS
jgi:hypothetical protein